MYSVVLLALLQGDKSAPKEDVVLRWNETVLQAIKTARTPPPQAARHLAMVHVAVYDAVNSIERSRRPYRFEVPAKAGASAEIAAAVAAHRVLVSLYPRQVARFDAALDDCCADIPNGKSKDDGVAVGQAVAEKMLAWRATDGSTRKAAHPGEKKRGQWRPTPPGYKPALLPQWPRMTCFCMDKGEQFRPGRMAEPNTPQDQSRCGYPQPSRSRATRSSNTRAWSAGLSSALRRSCRGSSAA